ncbi:hypothetical protein AB0D11_43290 [Streptomyces monashensis]|uniref:hypothetical protein n=1 Tax=Streptomyces monashensis TaxID=1678012 RepID=UPI0033F876A7
MAADTVRRWRHRLLAEWLDSLVKEPRPGRPPTIGIDEVEVVVIATLAVGRGPDVELAVISATDVEAGRIV